MNVLREFPNQRCINITIIDDNSIEPLEAFQVSLSSTDRPVIVNAAASVAQVTIIDGDTPLRAPIGLEQSVYVTNENNGSRQVCVVANGLLTQNVTVIIFSQDGSATG